MIKIINQSICTVTQKSTQKIVSQISSLIRTNNKPFSYGEYGIRICICIFFLLSFIMTMAMAMEKVGITEETWWRICWRFAGNGRANREVWNLPLSLFLTVKYSCLRPASELTGKPIGPCSGKGSIQPQQSVCYHLTSVIRLLSVCYPFDVLWSL